MFTEKEKQETTSEDEFFEPFLVLKLLVVGEAGVGKTSLIRRYVDQTWDPRTLKTIGVDFSLKNVDVPTSSDENTTIKLQIWDFCGESRFRQLLPVYAQGTHGVFFCFDLSRPETLDKLQEWKEVLTRALTRPAVGMVLGLKSDLVSTVDLDEIRQAARDRLGITHALYCSAKTGGNVEQAFSDITKILYDRHFNK